MSFLSKDHIREQIIKHGMVQGYGDIEGQLTANGFDFRLAAVIEITRAGRLSVNKKDNRAPTLGKAWVLPGFEGRLTGYGPTGITVAPEGKAVELDPSKAYYALTVETLQTPAHIMTKIQPRSSFYRFTQSVLEVGFGEAGYNGYLTFMIVPTIAGGEVELGSRFAQVAFAQLSSESAYAGQKETNYQGGKIF